jgi:hypothetical protein
MISPVQSQSLGIADLISALAKAQGAIGDIPRNRTVTVVPRSGGQSYQFKYATLSAIIDAIKKPLSENGLAYTQVLSHDADGGYYVLTTTLHHGNQFISSKVPLIAEGGTNQQFGSALTYMKRYTLAALLGIAADEDDDGNAADGNEIKAVSDKAKPAPKAPAENPISTGASSATVRHVNEFTPELIPVPLTKDGGDTDWMAWGQSFIAMARAAPSATSLAELEAANKMPLQNMEKYAPKMYANMTLALIKVRKAVEKIDA